MPDEQDTLRREWLEIAPAWIQTSRQGGDLSRKGMLDQYMLVACGDVAGLRILDSGCGEGRFSRILAERGAQYVLGVDACPPFIDAARELQSSSEEYVLGDAEDLSFLQDASFDLAVSYLNHCDLRNFQANVEAVYRVLKDQGRFVVANVHPMRSAANKWMRAADGTKQHFILDHYFDEGERQFVMMQVQMTNFHRTLSTYVRGFLQAGFTLEDVIEPTISPETAIAYPDLSDEQRVPNFIIYVLRK
ncbi:class I SAM-dependent methyltransferase [Candidatus Darwinibacter acetoxidans]